MPFGTHRLQLGAWHNKCIACGECFYRLADRLFILTGAGVSTESGLPTFVAHAARVSRCPTSSIGSNGILY
jgi:hypothetical protein